MTRIITIGAVVLLIGIPLGYLIVQYALPHSATTKTQTVSDAVLLPDNCVDTAGATPVITSISTIHLTIGSTLQLRGCNFAGFEGAESVWIQNAAGEKGILAADTGSTAKQLTATLQPELCQQDVSASGQSCSAQLHLAPGNYTLFTMPWGKVSNTIAVTIE